MKLLISLSKTAKIMCAVLLCLCAFFLIAGIAVSLLIYPFDPPGPYAVGLFIGTVLSMVKVVLMEKMYSHAADIGEGKSARNYGALQVLFRNLLTLGVLLMVFFFRDIFGLFGTIIGILSLQLTAYITGFILRKDSAQV